MNRRGDIVCWEDEDGARSWDPAREPFECPCGSMCPSGDEHRKNWFLYHLKHSSGWCRHMVRRASNTPLLRFAVQGGYYQITQHDPVFDAAWKVATDRLDLWQRDPSELAGDVDIVPSPQAIEAARADLAMLREINRHQPWAAVPNSEGGVALECHDLDDLGNLIHDERDFDINGTRTVRRFVNGKLTYPISEATCATAAE